MDKGLMNIDWSNINNFSDEEISYFLFLEGKSIEIIGKIRNMDNAVVQKHIIDGKIKYRFLAKSKNTIELFKTIAMAGKQDRVSVLNNLDVNNKIKLIGYIRDNYVEMPVKEKESAVWILGEMKESSCLDILKKASVHKAVNIRRLSVSAMGKICDDKAEIALIRALDDENSQVVSYAIKSLGKLKCSKAITKIQYIHDNTSKEYLKEAAKVFLSEVNLDT